MGRAKSLMILSYATIIYVFIFIISIKNINREYNFQKEDFAAQMSNEDRNENSTPRSFILPATPAIALEQEKSRRKLDNEDYACLAALSILGYDIGRDGTSSNARFFASLYKYQKNNSLELTGRLSIEVKRHLGC